MVYELREHQKEALRRSEGKTSFALFMEQGTGKTGTLITEACNLYSANKIQALAVVAPNGVHDNWLEELPLFATVAYRAAAWRSSPIKEQKDAIVSLFTHADVLTVFTMNVEALSKGKGIIAMRKFLSMYNAMLVVDESTRIKTPGANRTKTAIELGALAKYRRIATGTPITNSPLDIYAPMRFLDESILGCSNFFMFKARYAVEKTIKLGEKYNPRKNRVEKRQFKKVVGYKNLDNLMEKIKPYSYMIKKDDCLDLPDKIYQVRYVELGKEQRRLYEDVRKRSLVELDGAEQITMNALTKALRLQQIAGGFFVDDDGESHAIQDNKGVSEVVALLDELQGGVVIWCRFRDELRALAREIRNTYGNDHVVEYHGDIDADSRIEAISSFQSGASKVFLCTYCAATGITLTAGRTVIYYSQSFSYEDRLQSEDRCHRMGTKFPVTYITLIRKNTIDEKIISAFSLKRGFADYLSDSIRDGVAGLF